MIDIVIPTIGRSSLEALLASIGRARGARPHRIVIVDDRRERRAPLALGRHDADLHARISIVHATGHGPAAARNAGWRASRAAWIAFLDDDVLVDEDWLDALARDVTDLGPEVAASFGRVHVPLPARRKPTDWERNVFGLERAAWITADCAFRRTELLALGGFDERFPRAYREDADLALRTLARGKRLVAGLRGVTHPVRPAPWWASVRAQAGNADDVLMGALHGPAWRERAAAPRGAFGSHAFAAGAAIVSVSALVMGRRAFGGFALGLWLAQTLRFAWRRIAPGPCTAPEVATLVATSIVIPFCAVWHRISAAARLQALVADNVRAPKPVAPAVLLDRDGTLIADMAFNTETERVAPMPLARAALDRLRAAGLLTAIVSNQSGVGLGLLRCEDVDAINTRVEELLGPLGPVVLCLHAAHDGCACRKPRPGLIYQAARVLGVAPSDCVVIGDIGADVEAAVAAGARAVLVPTPATRPQEIAAAPVVAHDIDEAARFVLSGRV